MKYLQYFLPFFMLIISLIDIYYCKKYYIFIIIIFILVPILEYFPRKIYNVILSINIPIKKNKSMYKMILYLWILAHYMYYIAVLYYIKNNNINIKQWILNSISIGFLNGGFGTAVAHELFHKTKIDRFLSYSLLLLINYPHFQYIHNKKHHVNVATNNDHSSAKLGENFYKMFVKSVIYNYLIVLYDHPIFFVWLHIVQFGLCFIIYAIAGVIPLLFHISQSFFSIVTIEIANYIQHYGLRRKIIGKDNRGNIKYESVKKHHCWDHDGVLTCALTWGLPNHSDHHTCPTKYFHNLEKKDGALQMPYPYPIMYTIALIPPLWFRIMDKIIINKRQE